MSKTVSSGVGASVVSDSSGDDLTVIVDLPALQLEALNVDYAGAILEMPALGLQPVELESPLDSDEEGSFDGMCVDCDGETDDECEDCGDPLCQACGDVCAYCVG